MNYSQATLLYNQSILTNYTPGFLITCNCFNCEQGKLDKIEL